MTKGVFVDLKGKKFNRLFVLGRDNSISDRTYWKCKCDCGKETLVRADSLTTGLIKSCGCFHSEAAREIGLLKREPLEGKSEKICCRCKKVVKKEYFSRKNWLVGGRPCINCVREKTKIYNKKTYKLRRGYRLKVNYGITIEQFEAMVERQFGRCLGCQQDFDFEKKQAICVDHDHNCCSGQKSCGKCVRGLLCQNCNNILGRAKEDKLTLRRLISYLGYDRKKWMIYVVGSLRNKNIPEVAKSLRGEGFEVIDDWYSSGEKADDSWQEYEKLRGRSYSEALKGISAQNVYMFDRSYLDLCDAAVLVAPYGCSAGIEAGYLKGCGKPVFIFDQNSKKRFEVMPNFVLAICHSIDELKNWLGEILVGPPEVFSNLQLKSNLKNNKTKRDNLNAN